MTAPEPYWHNDDFTVYAGDCLDVLRGLPDNSVDAVVTDPPYDLTDGGQKDCASDVLRNAIIRDAANDEAASHERSVAFRISLTAATPVGVGGVDLNHDTATGQEEINGDGPVAQIDDVLMDGGNPVLDQQGERGEFRLWVREGEPRCVGTCRCLAHGGASVLRIPVGLRYDPPGDTERTTGVVAFPRAELPAVLSLDVRGVTAELLPARGADAIHPRFLLLPAKTVRARAAARRLAAILEPGCVGDVPDATDGTGSFHVRAHRDLLKFARPILASRGFMGRTWDGSGVAFDERTWAEVARVMKPGAHLLAFGAPRTVHHLAAAIERAGMDIRDGIDWIQAAGFPKSLDVSKAIDRAASAEREVVGVSPDSYDRSASSWQAEGGRPHGMVGRAEGERVTTAPATDDARRWAGWGTSLKPAREPVVVARKPLAGTVAANVTTWGTGALNIDGCRVGTNGGTRDPGVDSHAPESVSAYGHGLNGRKSEPVPGLGRWPSNTVFSHAVGWDGTDLCGGPDGCVPGCPVAELDKQSGVGVTNRPGSRSHAGDGWGMAAQSKADMPYYGDSGGASRFFPVFRYEAKAPASQRPRAQRDDGTWEAHSTVKPLDLMRWLVRLVTPPGGTALDPFAGSGTTAEACLIERFRCITIERDPTYLPLIKARLSKPIQPTLGLGDF